MNVDIRNFAKVGHVNVDLDGLTVIAGKNGTGKSTVSRSLMAYFTLLRRMGSHVRRQRFKSVVELLSDKLPLSGPAQWRLRRINDEPTDEIPYDMLQREYWDDPRYLQLTLRRLMLVHRMPSGAERLDSDAIVQKQFPEIQQCVFDVLNRKDSEYEELIYRTKFNQIFKGQIAPLFNPDAETSLTIETQEARQSLSFKGETMPCYPVGCKSPFSSVLYLEPINILDILGDDGVDDLCDRYDSGSGRWTQVLKSDRYAMDVSLEKDRKITKARKVLDAIGNVLHGSLVDVDGDVKFKEDGLDRPIELLNLASGVKSIAMLSKAIGNGSLQEGDLLIADEPESNLHPEWQVRFAEFLVLLRKELGVKLLLNTHSPYFLKAIETYTKKHDIRQGVHYYFMQETEGGSAVSDEITNDLSVAYEALYKPLAEIMEA